MAVGEGRGDGDGDGDGRGVGSGEGWGVGSIFCGAAVQAENAASPTVINPPQRCQNKNEFFIIIELQMATTHRIASLQAFRQLALHQPGWARC